MEGMNMSNGDPIPLGLTLSTHGLVSDYKIFCIFLQVFIAVTLAVCLVSAMAQPIFTAAGALLELPAVAVLVLADRLRRPAKALDDRKEEQKANRSG